MLLPKRILSFLLLILAGAVTALAAGDVDADFSPAAYGDLVNQGTINVVRRQPDGKILIGGIFTEVQGFAASGLARLNADGTVDKTFLAPDFASHNSNNGVVTGGGDIRALAIQPDGKIIVAGNIYMGVVGQTGVRLGVRRINADGSNDPTFNVELLLFGSVVYDVKLLADGKILIAGIFTVGANTSTKNLARLNADGTRDATFVDNTANATFKDIEVQPDGKIVAGGYSAAAVPGIYRYNPDGTVDGTFITNVSGNGGVEAVELQADGKIVVGGDFTVWNGTNQGRITRLNTDGSRDTGFNSAGAGANGIVNDVAVRSDAKIVIGGGFSSFNALTNQRLARLNADGTADNTFPNNGMITDTAVNDLEILPDNRILAGLNTSTLIDPMLRFSADGAFDTTFVVKANRGGSVGKILRQPDGKVLVAGNFVLANGVQRRSMARFNADGSLDVSFVPYFNTGFPLQTINAMALQTDGKILVGTTQGIVLQRLNVDGTQDTSFNAALPSSSIVYDIAIQADGKILLGGNMTYILPRFARLNADGSRDTSFNPAQPDGFVRKVVVQPDGKILLAGSFSNISDIAVRNSAARFNPNGVLDNGFIPPTGTPGAIDIALQMDGKVVLVGTGIRRLNSNGTLETSFTTNSEVDTVVIQPNGKILVGGSFSLIGIVSKNGIARFNTDFTLDSGYATTANGAVFSIYLQSDGKILLGGGFSKINGIPRTRIARLLNTTPQSKLFDYDGDGKADVSVFRASENNWYILRSSDFGVTQTAFAVAGDVPAPADFDGDGKTDVAIFRPSNGNWWSLSSVNGQQINAQLGQTGDIPLPSDFDGDGRADYVVFRPSTSQWLRTSSSNGATSNKSFGLAGDKPVIGDFDGDGKSDVAIYRPSDGNWWWQSSVDNVQRATKWGISTDIPAPADYDGDGKTDFAVFRPSTGVWYIYNSATQTSTIGPFGLTGDKPVPADFDGDGKADIAVYRPSDGIWYLLRSTTGFTGFRFGIATDTPTQNSFLQ